MCHDAIRGEALRGLSSSCIAEHLRNKESVSTSTTNYRTRLISYESRPFVEYDLLFGVVARTYNKPLVTSATNFKYKNNPRWHGVDAAPLLLLSAYNVGQKPNAPS